MRTARLALIAICLSAAGRLSANDLVKWRTIAAGEAESKKTGKPVLYFMTADWCSPCHAMKREVFGDPRVAARVNADFIPIEVLDRRREEGKNAPDAQRVFTDYRCRGFPTLTVTRPGSTQAFQLQGWAGKSSTADFLSVAVSRLEEMEKAASKGETP